MIRPATLDDLPRLVPLYKTLVDTFQSVGPGHAATPAALPMRIGYYEQILRQQAGCIFVAEVRKALVGMIACEYRMADAAFQWRKMVIIQDLLVLPRHRKGGIARQLSAAALARCTADGREIVYIWIAPTNRVMLEQSASWDFQDEYIIKTKLLTRDRES